MPKVQDIVSATPLAATNDIGVPLPAAAQAARARRKVLLRRRNASELIRGVEHRVEETVRVLAQSAIHSLLWLVLVRALLLLVPLPAADVALADVIVVLLDLVETPPQVHAVV